MTERYSPVTIASLFQFQPIYPEYQPMATRSTVNSWKPLINFHCRHCLYAEPDKELLTSSANS